MDNGRATKETLGGPTSTISASTRPATMAAERRMKEKKAVVALLLLLLLLISRSSNSVGKKSKRGKGEATTDELFK